MRSFSLMRSFKETEVKHSKGNSFFSGQDSFKSHLLLQKLKTLFFCTWTWQPIAHTTVWLACSTAYFFSPVFQRGEKEKKPNTKEWMGLARQREGKIALKIVFLPLDIKHLLIASQRVFYFANQKLAARVQLRHRLPETATLLKMEKNTSASPR